MSDNADFLGFFLDQNYMMHYGVAGMKWGVWNDETAARYAGHGYSNKKSESIFDTKHERESTAKIVDDITKAGLGGKIKMMYKKDRSLNCVNCSVAFLMRHSGYDVSAKSSDGMKSISDAAKIFGVTSGIEYISDNHDTKDFYTSITEKEFSEIERDIIKKQGNGASGLLFGDYVGMNCGHMMAYVVENDKLQIVDAQRGTLYKDGYKSEIQHMRDLIVFRTDNAKVDEQAAKNYVGSRDLVKTVDYKNKWSRSTNTAPSDNAYIKAAKRYLSEHPDSEYSIADLVEKYQNEWGGE